MSSHDGAPVSGAGLRVWITPRRSVIARSAAPSSSAQGAAASSGQAATGEKGPRSAAPSTSTARDAPGTILHCRASQAWAQASIFAAFPHR